MTTTTEVVQLPQAQIKEAGEVLARAFHDDPYWLWVLPDESKRARALPWFMKVWTKYCQKHGEAYTVADKVEGAALWLPPGKYPMSVAGTMQAGMFLAPLKFGPGAFGRFMSSLNYLEELHKRDVPPRHWYLATLGVDPPRQGQGVGGTLMQPVLARSDADGLPCYLETETEINVGFYNRHGFEVIVEVDLPKDGPHIWTMKREPVG
jgi:ribosomal protein S18 acetylase RimI-like enzyme